MDNQKELYKKLNINNKITPPSGGGGLGSSDHEYLLAAFEKYGENCVQHLIGDFSFVVWDKQTQNLFMAKDQLGIKPLFYLHNRDVLLFATSITAIEAAFDKPLPLNKLYIAHELKSYQPPVHLTFFEDIHRLQPAHFCSFKVGTGLKAEQRYWELTPMDISHLKTDEERLAEVRKQFEEAVRCRLRTVKKVGCQLSGGMDSSAIAVLASRLMDKNQLHTFSFVLNDKTRAYSERGIDEQGTQNDIINYADLHRANHHPIEEFHFKAVFEEWQYQNLIIRRC